MVKFVYIGELKSLDQIKSKGLRIIENGLNEFWLLEAEFIKPMLTSPKDCKKYEVKPSELPYCILIIEQEKKVIKEKYPYIFRYIQHAEKEHINNRPSLSSRVLWYNIGAKEIPHLSFNYIINEYGRTFKVKAYSNNNFHNIFPKSRSTKSIWLYLNSTVAFLVQQLIMRSNLGDGAGKIEAYELANFPVIDVNLEDLEIELGVLKNLKEEFGSLEKLEVVSLERRLLDSAILEAVGYRNKKERDEALWNLYKATFQIIQARFTKAQSLKSVKTQRNKVSFKVYLEQLKASLVESKTTAKRTLKFATEIKKLVTNITSETKLQNKIFDAYWKERFGESYNEKKIIDTMQGKFFD